MLQTLTRHGQHSLAMELATKVAEPSWVSHFCACIGSPCLRQCVHGAPIGGGSGPGEAAKRGGGGARPSGGGDGDGSRMLSHIASAAALTRRLRQLAAPYNIAHFTRSARKRIVAMQARPSAAEVPYATLRSQQQSQQRG